MSKAFRVVAVLAAAGLGLSAPPVCAAPKDTAASAAQAPGHRSAKGVGLITVIDPSQAMVTLKHEPIPSLGWPTMVMPFRVTPPGLLKGLKVGQKVVFETREAEGLPEITAIRRR